MSTRTITEVKCDGCGKALNVSGALRYRIRIELVAFRQNGQWSERKHRDIDACSKECARLAMENGIGIAEIVEPASSETPSS